MVEIKEIVSQSPTNHQCKDNMTSIDSNTPARASFSSYSTLVPSSSEEDGIYASNNDRDISHCRSRLVPTIKELKTSCYLDERITHQDWRNTEKNKCAKNSSKVHEANAQLPKNSTAQLTKFPNRLQIETASVKLSMSHEQDEKLNKMLKKVPNPYQKSCDLEKNNLNHDNFKSSQSAILNCAMSQLESGNLSEKIFTSNEPKYSPLPYVATPDPLIVKFTLQNRPFSSRKLTAVSHVFDPPVSNFFHEQFHSFNPMQSELAPILKESNENIVVSAPTGAGKTCVFEIAIGRLFNDILKLHKAATEGQGGAINMIPNDKKIVYIAPNKALCEERYKDWSTRLGSLGLEINCSIITGDSWSDNTFQRVASSHLILTTPEKWDSVTRKWSDHLFLLGSVKLLLIDEVHLLGDAMRGACLEAVVCRMKTVQRAVAQATAMCENSKNISYAKKKNISIFPAMQMRIVAVSATLPNINDISSFLGAPKAYEFDFSFRPVPLTTNAVGFGYVGNNQYLFNKSLNKHIPTLLRQYSDKKATIIFCHTKKDTEILASEVSQKYHQTELQTDQLQKTAKMTTSKQLSRCITKGFAYHHAGLSPEDRRLVEECFIKGLIRVLCATSTLAVGVNLPAHLVIIKGTVAWRGTGLGYQNIDNGTLLQMIGRAGRPGLDTSGRAVIMTDKKSIKKYEKISYGLEIVESQLLAKLIETLNTEVSQLVISDVSQAIDWLKNTFFFSRVRKNPKYYGMQGKTEKQMDSYLMEQVIKCMTDLCESGVISFDEDGFGVAPLPASHIMSAHMVDFKAMKKLMAVPHDAGPKNILLVLSSCDVLHLPVRRAEKKCLNEMHGKVKYNIDMPISKVRIQKPWQKAYVLLQASIGQQFFEEFSLRQEMSLLEDDATRMLGALEDFSIRESKHGKVALESLLLRRSLATSLWNENDGILNQLKGVGAHTTTKLSKNGIRTFKDVLSYQSHDIEQACGRKYPFGHELRKAVSKILKNSLTMSAHIENGDSGDQRMIVVQLQESELLTKDITDKEIKDRRIVTYTLLVYTDRPGGLLMFRSSISCSGKHQIPCPLKFGMITISLVSNVVGLDMKLKISGNFIDETNTHEEKKLTPLSSSSKRNGKKYLSIAQNNSTKISEKLQQVVIDGKTDKSIPIQSAHYSAKVMLSSSKTPNKPNKSYQPFSVSMNSQTQISNNTVTPSPNHIYPRQHYKAGSKSCDDGIGLDQTRWYHSKEKALHTSKQSINRREINHQFKEKKQESWPKEKKEQLAMQRSVFNHSRENPFSFFKFDPNNIESNLDSLSRKSSIVRYSTEMGKGTNQFYISRGYRRTVHCNDQSLTVGSSRTRGAINQFLSGKRKRALISSVHLKDQELLRMKACEQEAYTRHRVISDTRTPLKNLNGGLNRNATNLKSSFDLENIHFTQEFEENLSPFKQWKQNKKNGIKNVCLNHRPLFNSMNSSDFYEDMNKAILQNRNTERNSTAKNEKGLWELGETDYDHEYVPESIQHDLQIEEVHQTPPSLSCLSFNQSNENWISDQSISNEISHENTKKLSRQNRMSPSNKKVVMNLNQPPNQTYYRMKLPDYHDQQIRHTTQPDSSFENVDNEHYQIQPSQPFRFSNMRFNSHRNSINEANVKALNYDRENPAQQSKRLLKAIDTQREDFKASDKNLIKSGQRDEEDRMFACAFF